MNKKCQLKPYHVLLCSLIACALSAQAGLRWHWNIADDAEGWTVVDLDQVDVTNGTFSATVSGSDPRISSPDNLGLDLSGISNIYVRARNGSSSAAGRIFFQTDANPTFIGNSVGFTAVASDPGFTTYAVDMSGHVNWNGTLKRLRVDLPDANQPGSTVEFDWIAVGEAGLRPNILFFMADDLGWNDTSINGSTFYNTPALERLAERGLSLTQAYTASPLCSPTRASILTGRTPGRLRFTTPNGHLESEILDPVLPASSVSVSKVRIPQSCTRLDTNYVTYAETMLDAGYSTAFMGKWHLGRDPYIPENHGFETVIGGRHHPGPPGSYFAPYSADSNLPAVPDGTHVNDLLADEAMDYLQNNRNQPFLLNLWFYDVHAPFECKESLRANYLGQASDDGRQKNPTYGAMVEAMDVGLGRVVDRLDELGLTDNTVILFFSDNGGNMYNWVDDALPTHNWPFRNGKGSIYEGGVRVPCVVVWPGHTATNAVSEELLLSTDFYPTILEMAGLESDPVEALDAVSQTNLFAGGASGRTNLFCHYPHWIPSTGSIPGCWVRQGDWKLTRFFHDADDGNHRYALYNLAADPHESVNLAALNPSLVSQLDAAIEAYLVDSASLVPLPNPAYAPVFYGWTPNDEAMLSYADDGGIQVMGNGFSPQVESVGDLSALGTPSRMVLEMKSRSLGDGKLAWRLPGQTEYAESNSVSFAVTHDDVTYTYDVPFAPGGPVEAIRIQPSSDVSASEIKSIQLYDAQNTLLKEWAWADSDGDGTGDLEEIAQGRDPQDPSDMAFHFETEGNFEGWGSARNIEGFSVSNGVLQGTSLNTDPHFEMESIHFAGAEVPVIAIRIRSGWTRALQFFWAFEGGTFSQATMIPVNYIGSDDWEILEIDLSAHANWNGKQIDKLRIDPITTPDWFEIDWVRAANGDADNDGLSDVQEAIAGSDRLDPADAGFEMTAAHPVAVDGLSGRLYSLQWCDNLVSSIWSTVESIGPLEGSQPVSFTHGTPSSNGYFRVLVEMP